jgi:signal transduction histidine kinase
MHEDGSDRVIAVAEADEASPQLTAGLARARMQTTGIVGLLSLAMFASLFGIVRRGSRVIGAQRKTLEERVTELTALLKENASLQEGIVDVNRRATERNDKALRRIGAELHDGPVQLIALSLLRLESLKLPGMNNVERRNYDDLDAIESALRDALKEVRDLCSGLALPNLQGVSVSRVVDYAIMNHERRSRTRVKRQSTGDLNVPAPSLVLMCVYRFIQEALNNAVKHAGGKGQAVTTVFDGQKLKIEVADGGPGMKVDAFDPARFVDGHGLGLAGLKDRVETLGGRFLVESAPGQGTRVTAHLGLEGFGLAATVAHSSGIALQ